MSRVAINLLPERQAWYVRRQRWWAVLQRVSLVVAGGYAVVLVGSQAWRAVVANQLNGVNVQQAELKQQIQTLAAVESMQLVVKSKLARLAELRRGTTDVASLVKEVMALVPVDVSVSEVKLESSGTVELTGTTMNPVGMAQLVLNLENREKAAKLFSRVELTNLSKSSTGEYGATVVVVPIGKEKAK